MMPANGRPMVKNSSQGSRIAINRRITSSLVSGSAMAERSTGYIGTALWKCWPIRHRLVMPPPSGESSAGQEGNSHAASAPRDPRHAGT